MEKEFNLSEKLKEYFDKKHKMMKTVNWGTSFLQNDDIVFMNEGDSNLAKDIKEFIKIGDKKVNDAVMYSDMDEPDFWSTSTISPKEAELRARYYSEFWEEMRKHAGDKLTKEQKEDGH